MDETLEVQEIEVMDSEGSGGPAPALEPVTCSSVQFSSVQSLSRVRFFATP